MPKFQNAIAVGIGMDTTQFRKDVNYANRLIGQAKSSFRDFGKTMKLIDLDLKEGTITRDEHTAAINKAILASEKMAQRLKSEADAVKQLEEAKKAALAAEKAKKADALGLGLYSGAKPVGPVPSSPGGSVSAYLNAQETTQKAAKETAKAIREAQAAVEGWDNGLKRLGTSKFAQELARSKQGADAWAAGMKSMSDKAEAAAKSIREAQAAVEGWDNGLKRLGTSKFAQELARSKQGADAWAAGMKSMSDKAEAAAKAIREAQAAVEGWDNGLKRLGTSKFAQELARSKQGADAWAAGMRNMAEANDRARAATAALVAETQEYYRSLRVDGLAYLRQFETAQQRVNRQLAEARRFYQQGAISAHEYARAASQIRAQNSLLISSFRQFRGVLLTVAAPLVLTLKAYDGLMSSIKLSAELDAATAKFRVFTGSALKAQKMMEDIRDMASSSPVSFAGGQRAVTTLLQFGVAENKAMQSFREIAEITGGETQRMEALALAFAQSQAAGRLLGQELLQMVNAGFNPLKVISEQTGESLIELKKRMEQGGISSEAVAKAFKDATSEGGRFNGLLEEIANTTAGKLVRAQSAIEQAGTALGKSLDPFVQKALFLVTREAEAFVRLMGHDVKRNYFQQVAKDIENLQYRIDSLRGTGLFDILPFSNRGMRDHAAGQLEKQVDARRRTLAILRQEESVRKRIAEGEFVTDEERSVIDRLDLETRNEKLVLQEEFDQLLSEFQRDFAKAQGEAERTSLRVTFADKVGLGFLADEDVELLKQYRKDLEAYDKDAADAKRAADTFRSAIEKLEATQTESRYGENADRVQLLRTQSADTERKILDDLIAQGATYSEIYSAANKAAQAEADRMETLEQAAQSARLEEELKHLDSQAKYLQEIVDWGKEEARIRQIIRDDGLSRADAELKRAAEGRLEAEKRIKELRDSAKEFETSTTFGKLVDGVAELSALLQLGFIDQSIFDREADKLARSVEQSERNIAAPKAIQAGSTEAFALQAQMQAKVISENIRLANRAFTVQKATAEAAKKTSEILDEVRDSLGVLPTP